MGKKYKTSFYNLPNGELFGITEQERKVLLLLAEGRPDQEIADLLHTSVTTVRSHVAHLRMKLGVHNRWAVVRRCEEAGVIPLGRPPAPPHVSIASHEGRRREAP